MTFNWCQSMSAPLAKRDKEAARRAGFGVEGVSSLRV